MNTTQILYPEWRDSNRHRRFPFDDGSTLLGSTGLRLPDGVVLDARIYPNAVDTTVYLYQLVPSGNTIVITLAIDPAVIVCTGVFDRSVQSDVVELFDPQGRPAGVLVVDPYLLSTFVTDTISFTQTQATFAPTVVTPMPYPGVSGITIAGTSTVFTGDVWLVGGEGVILSKTLDGAIRVDIVGEPLFVRKSYFDAFQEYQPLKFIKTINGLLPDAYGNFNIVAGVVDDSIYGLSTDNIVRVEPIEHGIKIYLAGAKNA
ncbi:MAG: hypothetical protein D0530_04755 [Methylococcales bacterium]|nr:MAG: hypothetical protein D0530_04755 [Methylococcales bacterium]